MYFTEGLNKSRVEGRGNNSLQALTIISGTDLRALALAGVPVFYSFGCLTLFLTRFVSQVHEWRFAKATAVVAVVFSCVSGMTLVLNGPLVTHGRGLLGIRIDPPGAIMLLLVAFIGWVILRYSEHYLAGDPAQGTYLRALLACLAAVACLVVTNNLVTFWLAWVGTSLSLHLLLTLYRDRQPAIIVAHKKFLASRIGDLFLLSAILIIARQTGTFQIDQALHYVEGLAILPTSLRAAAVLIALSAVVKCAQLPLHGWLIQVMEAPTPVSALLHAGIVNLGGFMLIRLAPLGSAVIGAQVLLVLAGCITAVIASLVMMTRVSIKVNLAWSTCAQMGFMLMQCGLGLYDLALLHLLAHSLYKAYAFLGSGGTVEVAKLKTMAPKEVRPRFSVLLMTALPALLTIPLAAHSWGINLRENPSLAVLGGVVGLAVVPFLASAVDSDGWTQKVRFLLTGAAIPFLYFGLHRLFAPLVQWSGRQSHTPPALALFVGISFLILFVIQGYLRSKPDSVLSRTLYPWFYAGLYLDEAFTRVTFSLWPAQVVNTSTRRDAARNLPSPGVIG